jgi:transcriptional regulator with XRE-family HTH domain
MAKRKTAAKPKPPSVPRGPRPLTSDELTRLECGKRLREAREAKKLGQREAAHIAGVSFQHWNHYEHGRRVPTYQLLHRMVNRLGLDLRTLFKPKPTTANGRADREASS